MSEPLTEEVVRNILDHATMADMIDLARVHATLIALCRSWLAQRKELVDLKAIAPHTPCPRCGKEDCTEQGRFARLIDAQQEVGELKNDVARLIAERDRRPLWKETK